MVDRDEYLVDTVDHFRGSELGICFMKKFKKILKEQLLKLNYQHIFIR